MERILRYRVITVPHFHPCSVAGVQFVCTTHELQAVHVLWQTVLYVPFSLYYRHRSGDLAQFLSKTHGHTGIDSKTGFHQKTIDFKFTFYHFASLRT